jgi:polysaccharide export outer membrane protein
MPSLIKSLGAFLAALVIALPLMSAEPAVATSAAPMASAVSTDYIIGPGDVLQVFVWRNPELTVTVPVRPDGKISSPLVEDMVAVGKSPSALARDVETKLAEYVRSPQVNVIVTQPASVFGQIKVVGEVRTQQALPFREGMTILDAVLAVGGLGDFASPNRTKLLRTEDGKEKEIRVRLGDLMRGGKRKENVLLRPNDIIIVPPSRF